MERVTSSLKEELYFKLYVFLKLLAIDLSLRYGKLLIFLTLRESIINSITDEVELLRLVSRNIVAKKY